MPSEEASYLVKRVQWRARKVPLVLQDLNGPCPLLAIANVLLLRGSIHLDEGVGEVTQERLVGLVADHMLDVGTLRQEEAAGGGGGSEEYRANMAANLGDAIALLPKLTTGVDVNVRFHDIQAFEFTEETAVFDLLGIPLLHGWLVDPEDGATAAAVGRASYNELVVQLVTALGSAATPTLTPSGSLARQRSLAGSSSGSTPRGSFKGTAASAAAVAAAAAQAGSAGAAALPTISDQEAGPAGRPPKHPQSPRHIDADMLAAALQGSLRVSTGGGSSSSSGGVEGDVAERTAGAAVLSTVSSTTTSMKRLVSGMMHEVVEEAFQSGSQSSAAVGAGGEAEEEATSELRSSEAVAAQEGAPAAPPKAEAAAQAAMQPEGSWQHVVLELSVSEQAAGEAAAAVAVRLRLEPSSLFPAAAAAGAAAEASAAPASSGLEAPVDAGHLTAPMADAAAVAAGSSAGSKGERPAKVATPGSRDDVAVQQALLAQQWLESNPSQLTFAGLMALHQGLRDGQLAVFFRNNHFSTLFKHDGGLFLLVTDQGYQSERDVVWEQLSSVDGDTQLVGADFKPFAPHAASPVDHDAELAATLAASAAEWDDDAHAGGGAPHEDADLALAMQLQQEEERVQRERQRRQEAQARQQQGAQRQQQQGGAAGSAPGTASSASGAAGRKKKKDKSSDCSIM